MKYIGIRLHWQACAGLAGMFILASSASAQVVLPQQEGNCQSCHSAEPATLANLVIDEVSGCDYSNADLFGGWGWNNDLGQSCPPLDSAVVAGAYAHDNSAPQATPVATVGCDYSNSDMFDGWGWNSALSESCPPLSGNQPTANPEPTTPAVNVCVDSDGDGWGWNGTDSCRVGEAPVVANDPLTQSPAVGACVDSDGDGWGWNGTDSCQVGVTPIVSNDPQTPSSPGAAECVDADGDGYGWDGTDTCVVGPTTPVVSTPVAGDCTVPAAGTTRVSSTGPVRSTGNEDFYPSIGPQCVVPTNQFNGPGLGFGDFLLGNNAWNGDKSTWNWSQCIALRENSGGTVSPSWTYDWGDEDALQPGYREWEVKSYPEILYGFKSNDEASAPCTTTGLPIKYSDMPDIDIAYSYTATQTNNRSGDFGDENNNPTPVTGGDRNIAVESFLHSSCDIKRGSESNREFELMVWLDHGPERLPSGSPPIATYTDSNSRIYDVYVKGQADPGYIAYVARNEVTSGTLDWDEFFTDAKNNAGTYGIRQIQDNWCLANILFGSEIWWGEGAFSLDYYQITQSY